MRPVVAAAALAFGPHLGLIRRPARRIGRAAIGLLERRRRAINKRS